MASLCAELKSLLSIWRAGAIGTQTKRCENRAVELDRMKCFMCGKQYYASARHLWAECDAFGMQRRVLEIKYKLPARWWQRQPMVTSKSGWVRLGAEAIVDRRCEMQVAACEMGLLVTSATKSLIPDMEVREASTNGVSTPSA